MIFNQNVFETWPLKNESINSIITSPPYYKLRNYKIPNIIIGGKKDCNHNFFLSTTYDNSNTPSNKTTLQSKTVVPISEIENKQTGLCIKCGAWQGQYGLEDKPFNDINSYVEHTRLWAKEAWRVLRNDGLFFLNLGDSYHNPTKWTNKPNPQTIANGNQRDLPRSIKTKVFKGRN